MAIKTVAGDATLGMRSSVATSLAIFEPFSAFTAMGWYYTGTNGVYRPIFTIGESETRLGAGSYVEVSVSAANALTLTVHDGVTETAYTGSALSANTWYAWAYVKGAAADQHIVYLAGDVASPAFVADITQTKVDNLTIVGGVFVSVPATTRICNFKLWNAVKTVTNLNTDRITWLLTSTTGGRHTAPLRFPADLWNYHPSDGGEAFDAPTYANGYRTHLTNLGSTALEYAVDPAVLKTVRCVTQVSPTPPFTLISDTSTPIWASDGTTRLNHQFQMDIDTAVGLPVDAVIEAHDLYNTTRRVEAGGFTASEFFYRVVGENDGEPADVATPPDRASAAVTITSVYVHRGTNGNALGTSSERDPVAVEDWDSVDPVEAVTRLFSYWWGHQISWTGLLNSPNPKSTPDIYETTEILLRISYVLPSDWVYSAVQGDEGEAEGEPEIWRLDVGGAGTGSGTGEEGGGDEDESDASGANDDNGEIYHASLVTRPFTPTSIMQRFAVTSSLLMTKAAQDTSLVVSVIQDLKPTPIPDTTTLDLSPAAFEENVIKPLDELSVGALTLVQWKFRDTDTPGGRWNLQRFEARHTKGEDAT